MNNIACCGFDCDYCPICINTKENNLEELRKLNKATSGNIQELGCLGCNSNLVNKMCNECFIKKCNIDKGIKNCSECNTFPCEYITKNISIRSMEKLKELRNK